VNIKLLNKKNVILITIDCFRFDFLGYQVNNKSISPHLDELVKEGTLFTQAIVNGPSTPFSFPSIFFSSYPLMDSNFPFVSESKVTLAEILSESGYKTAGFNSNPYLSKYYHYDKGYHYYYDSIKNVKSDDQNIGILTKFIKKHKILKNMAVKVLSFLRLRNKLNLPYERAHSINQKALSWIKEREENFFVWLHYMDTHHPFIPPKKYRNASDRQLLKSEMLLINNPKKVSQKELNQLIELYIATIRYVDDSLGEFIEDLKELDLLKNTLIIITADHGEEFKEHGGFSHHAKLYEELIHVPLIFSGPDCQKNVKRNDLVALIDLSPTIIDYLELEPNEIFQGTSFLSLITGKSGEYHRDGVISETLTKNGKVNLAVDKSFRVISYRTKQWKLIINFESKSKELYNISEDPEEKVNLYNQNQELVKYLEILIMKHIDLENKRKKLIDITQNLSKAGI
jgi:arylsulfatase A-like enzyme